MIRVDHFILSSGADRTINIWDLRTGKFVRSIASTHQEPVQHLLFPSNSTSLFSLSERLVVGWNFFPEAKVDLLNANIFL